MGAEWHHQHDLRIVVAVEHSGSEAEVAAMCPWHAACGGCPRITQTTAEQRQEKLSRIAGAVGHAVPLSWTPGRVWGYRRRIRMRVEHGRAAFFNPVKRQGCGVLTPELERAIRTVQRVAFDGPGHIEVRADDLDGRAGLMVHAPCRRGELEAALPNFVIAVRESRDRHQRFAVTDDVWAYVPLDAFVQVHDAANRKLLHALLEGARERGAKTFVDAYCGAGNHALALARAGMSGQASDTDGTAVTALSASAAAQDLPITTTIGRAAELTLGATELMVLNPPRAGLGKAAATLASHNVPHVALITCTTLALERDVTAFREAGYKLASVHAFDMFPHTAHVESLAWLAR